MSARRAILAAGTNAARAQIAARALGTYQAEAYDHPEYAEEETSISDLICDLRHWADCNSISWQRALDRAAAHYQSEKKEDEA